MAALLVPVVLLSAIQVSAQGDPAESIGDFTRFGLEGTLTTDDVTATASGLEVDAPWMASALKVERAFLDEQLSAWGTRTAFEVDSNQRVVLGGEDTAFERLALSEEPIFTFGDDDSILLQERPMWLAVTPLGDNKIRLDFDDGNTAGQAVYVANNWLATYGIATPSVMHEDGSLLNATATEDGTGWTIDVPHFSFVILGAADIDVRGKIGAIWVTPHPGERRWNETGMRLEIDVGTQLADYGVWVEKAWVDIHIAYPLLQDKSWTVMPSGGKDYYVIALTPAETPATLVVTTLGYVPNDDDPESGTPPLPDLFAIVNIPGQLYFAQFNLSVEQRDTRTLENPTVPVYVRTPEGTALRIVWRFTHQFLWDIATGLVAGETNGFVWIGPIGEEPPIDGLVCAEAEEYQGEMPGFRILACTQALKNEITSACQVQEMQGIPALDLDQYVANWDGSPIDEVYGILEDVSDPCELLATVFAWADLHILAAVYYTEIVAQQQAGGGGGGRPPTITVWPMQPYQGNDAGVTHIKKSMEVIETTFETAGIEFQDPKASEAFPSGWPQRTENDLNVFSDTYAHSLEGFLSAIMVYQGGTLTRSDGSQVNGMVGGIGGASDGSMTTDSWGFVNSAGLGAFTRYKWSAHEAGHLFGMIHGDAACGGYHWNGRQHQTIEAATGDNAGTPDPCDNWQHWPFPHYHFRYSWNSIYVEMRYHACGVAITCP